MLEVVWFLFYHMSLNTHRGKMETDTTDNQAATDFLNFLLIMDNIWEVIMIL